MTDSRTDIPSPSAPNFDQRVREALQTYLGRQGNPLDRGLTLRDMIESGLISLKDGYRLRPGGGGGLPLAPGPAATVDATPDLTPPPTPTGLTAVGAISHVFIEHDAPLYRQGHGHLRTRLYGKIVNTGDPLPTFGDATEIAQFSGTVYAHPSNPATTWRLWVKWESADGVLSASPAGGTNGIEAVTGQDVGALLDALAGQITESQLYADLGSRIDLIDTDAAGSVNDRIRTEAAGRITALLQEANARSAADSTLASTQEAIGTRTIDAASAILAEADARISAGSVIAAALDATGLQAGILAANAVNETARRVEDGFSIASTTSAITASQASTAAALQVERVVRATESEALSRQTSTLVSISGANVSALTMEQQTRAEETSASASQVTSLAATVGANAAAITSEQQARSDEASSAARQISTLSAATDAANAAIQVEQQARADQSSSLAQQTTTLASTTANATAGLLQEQLARTEENLATASAMIGLSSVVGDNTAGLKVEQQTRTDEASSSASQVAALVATAGSNSAAIQMEQLARSNETSATASQITSLSSAAGDNASTLKVLQQTQANAESASSAMNTTLASAVGGNAAAIQTELATRADADSASAGAVSTLAVASGVNTAGLFSEQQVRADASSSMASTVAGLAAVSSANSAGILAEQSARANAQTALAEQINTLSAATAENAASITNEQQARVDETVALATQVSTIQAEIISGAGDSIYRNFNGGVQLWTHARNGNPETVASATGARLDTDPDFGTCAEFTNFTAIGANIGPKEWMPVRPGRIYRLRAKFKVVTVASSAPMLFNTVIGCHTATKVVAGDGSAFSVNSTESISEPGVHEIESLFAHAGVSGSVSEFDPETALARPMLRANSNPDGSVIRVQFIKFEDITEELSLSAAIQTETLARANETGALASQITTLKASAGAAPGLSRLRFWGFDTGLEGWSSTYASASNGIATWAPTASNSSFIRSLSASEQYIGSQAPVIRARVRRLSGAGNWEGSLFHSTAAHVASTSYRKTISAPANPDVWNELEWDMSQLTTGGADYLDNEITALRIDLVSDAGTSVWEFDWIAVGTRSVTPQDAALQIEATTRALETGDLFAQYTVKIDVAGHVSGYGLASTANGSTPTSQFGVRANQFFVAPPFVILETAPTTDLYKGYVWVDSSVTPNVTRYYTGTEWSLSPQALPFSVQAGSAMINGVTVPAGVYMDSAFIRDGTITNAKIGNAAIDNAKISNVAADKLTAGSIAVGQYIQSTGYVAGTSGWKINGNGNAEFSNAVVRGTVYATNGQFWGTLLGGAATAYSSGLGFYAGGGTTTAGADYRWRVGSPTGARIQWTGSEIEVYNADNKLTLASGGVDYAAIIGAKPPAGATAGAPAGTLVNGVPVADITTAISSIDSKLDKASNTILSVATSGSAYVAGLRVGSLAWDVDGDWSSGKGIAITPNGILGHDGTKETFAIDSTTGEATFAGSLEAAGGTFKGTLTAEAVNAVNTINLAGQSVTIPIGSVVVDASSTELSTRMVIAGLEEDERVPVIFNVSARVPQTVMVYSEWRVNEGDWQTVGSDTVQGNGFAYIANEINYGGDGAINGIYDVRIRLGNEVSGSRRLSVQGFCAKR